MARITKRGRNPGVVDNWLDNLGLYRKNVAYDETCLFRAVSEQLFDCQIYHERVRKECIQFARENFDMFSHLVKSLDEWERHINLLKKHMIVCGNIEIKIISKKYCREIIIFDAVRQETFKATNNNFPSSLSLCLMDEDHYDAVYKKEHIMIAGFCQSIVYKILYENVFGISNVDDIVRIMLYEKNSIVTQAELLAEKKKVKSEPNNNEIDIPPLSEEAESKALVFMGSNNIAPFPFKVAKALDPTIYRNIEYDSWGEVRREMRLGEWYYGDNKLILGTRCILNDVVLNEKHDCYIQEIIKEKNMCVVYLTQLAEKRTVNYTDLSPEDDAKPWPLPYRFSKNLVIVGSPQVPAAEKAPRAIKKRTKDKRRTKSCSESSVISNIPSQSESVENVSAYVGVPLQMRNPNETRYRDFEVSTETQTDPMVSDQIMTPDIQPPRPRYHLDQTHWSQYLPPTPDTMAWPSTPTNTQNVFNFNMKPLIASAPVTPDVVPYHDANFPLYLNYPVDPYQTYNQWQPPPLELQPLPPKMEPEKLYEDPNKPQTIQNEPNFAQTTENENAYEQIPTIMSPPERPMLCTALTTQTAPIEMYSPMVPLPTTPMIYAQQQPEMAEMFVSTPPVMYNPPIDMQYMSPQSFIYPPTPPVTWYPTGVNAHGFIFPTRPQ